MKGLFLEEILTYMKNLNSLRGTEKKEYKVMLERYLTREIETNTNFYVHEVEFIRDSYNFRVRNNDDRILFSFNMFDKTCTISFNGKFENTIKLDMNKVK